MIALHDAKIAVAVAIRCSGNLVQAKANSLMALELLLEEVPECAEVVQSSPKQELVLEELLQDFDEFDKSFDGMCVGASESVLDEQVHDGVVAVRSCLKEQLGDTVSPRQLHVHDGDGRGQVIVLVLDELIREDSDGVADNRIIAIHPDRTVVGASQPPVCDKEADEDEGGDRFVADKGEEVVFGDKDEDTNDIAIIYQAARDTDFTDVGTVVHCIDEQLGDTVSPRPVLVHDGIDGGLLDVHLQAMGVGGGAPLRFDEQLGDTVSPRLVHDDLKHRIVEQVALFDGCEKSIVFDRCKRDDIVHASDAMSATHTSVYAKVQFPGLDVLSHRSDYGFPRSGVPIVVDQMESGVSSLPNAMHVVEEQDESMQVEEVLATYTVRCHKNIESLILSISCFNAEILEAQHMIGNPDFSAHILTSVARLDFNARKLLEKQIDSEQVMLAVCDVTEQLNKTLCGLMEEIGTAIKDVTGKQCLLEQLGGTETPSPDCAESEEVDSEWLDSEMEYECESQPDEQVQRVQKDYVQKGLRAP